MNLNALGLTGLDLIAPARQLHEAQVESGSRDCRKRRSFGACRLHVEVAGGERQVEQVVAKVGGVEVDLLRREKFCDLRK